MIEALLFSLLVNFSPLQIDSSEIEWTPDLVVSVLTERAIDHGANVSQVLRVGGCETGGTWSPYKVGGLGERGVGQWLPGRGNHWDRTPAWRVWHIDAVSEYRAGNPDIVWLDLDMLAWSFGDEAPAGNYLGWSCR